MNPYDSVVLVEGRAGSVDRLAASVFSTSDSASYRVCPKNTPWPRCPRQGLRAPALGSALHTLNHSVHVNWNYQS